MNKNNEKKCNTKRKREGERERKKGTVKEMRKKMKNEMRERGCEGAIIALFILEKRESSH